MAHVTFILFPGFPMLAYALLREALDLGNRMAGDAVFTWDTRAVGHSDKQASNGAVLSPGRTDWDDADAVDLALVLCGADMPARIPNGFRRFLGGVDAAGGRLGGVEGGARILAQLGQLDGHRAVLPATPARDVPAIDLVDRPHVLDPRRLTVAGGVAAGNAICAWMAEVASPALADEVSRGLATGRLPEAPEPEDDAAPATDPVIAEMESRMRAHLSAPLSLGELADGMGLTRKGLRGRCLRATGMKPSDYYLSLRLQHGADLLRNTAMPVSDIAAEAGFETLAGFSRSVRNNLGVSPSAVRKMARAARMVQKYA
jgi:AraC family carnitine catabolism transcriptional activator